jgi:photosystem II stability/assembly factor-like uncharacterized protein
MRAYIIGCLLLLLSTNVQLFSQKRWIWISPYPQGNGLESSCLADGYVYFWGEPETVISTGDGGETFNNYSPYTDIDDVGGSSNDQQRIAFADSMTGIVLSLGQGVFRTTDGGVTWDQVFPPSYFFSVTTFASSGVGWILGTSGAQKTTDAGATWFSFWNQQIFNDGTFSKIFALDEDRLWILKNFHYQGGGNIFYSSNGGIQWVEQNTSLVSDTSNQVSYYDMKISDNGLGLAVGHVYRPNEDTTNSFILRTNDFGSSWSYSELDNLRLSKIININESTWIIYGNRIPTGSYTGKPVQLRSTDGGQTWEITEDVFPGIYGYNYFYTAEYIPHFNTILVSTLTGIYRSTDFGQSYYKLTNETDIHIEDFAIDQNPSGEQQLVVAISLDNQYIISTNGGRDWIKSVLPTNIGSEITELAIAQDVIFIVVDGTRIYKSIDNGNSWEKMLTHYISYLRNPYAYNEDNIVIQGYQQDPLLFYSNNGGLNWTHAPYDNRFSFNSLQVIQPGEIFACGTFYDTSGTRGVIFKTMDSGFNWRAIDFPRKMEHIYMVSDHKGFAHSNYELYRTLDSGKTWNLSLSSTNYYKYYSNFSFQDSLHGVMRVSYYFLGTNDGGNSWHNANINLPLWGSLKRMAYNKYGDLLVLGESWGFLIYKNEQYISNQSKKVLSSKNIVGLSLSQNYPNPFNPITSIKYTLHRKAHVLIEIYNSIGQKIETLIDEEQLPDSYLIKWDASINQLSSGIYFYQVKVDNEVHSRSMIYIK